MSEFITGIENKLPRRFLDNRIKIEGNVISCMMNDMSRVADDSMDQDSWFTLDAKFYYNMMAFLWKKGITELSDVVIRTTFKDKVIDRYEENGGWEAIEEQCKLFQNTSTETYETYKNILCKENYICDLKLKGLFDATKQVIGPNGVSCIPYDVFKDMQTATEVRDWYEAAISDFNIPESDKVNEQCYLEDFVEFAENCECGMENGVPFESCGKDINGDEISVYPFLSRQILGFMEGTLNMIAGHSSCGKSSYNVGLIMSFLSQGRKVLIISNEEKSKAFYARIIVYLLYKYCKYAKLSKRKLLAGDVDEESMRQIQKAQDYFKGHYSKCLKFIAVSEMDMKINKKLIKENVLKGGFDTVLLDTFKLDFNTTGNTRTDLDLVRDSRELDALAKKYNIIMLASIQLAMNSKGVLFLTSNQLSNSKQITEVLESLLMMRNVYPEELDKDNAQYFCKPFRKQLVDKLDENGHKIVDSSTGEVMREWKNVPFEIDTSKGDVWRMLFVSKTRAGSNSEDTGQAYLLKYRGDYCVFSESCQCIPRHGYIQ